MRLNADQHEFALAVRSFCDDHCRTLAQRDALTEDGLLANSPELLAKLAALGWLGVSLPEVYGGGGGEEGREVAAHRGVSVSSVTPTTCRRHPLVPARREIVGGRAMRSGG